MSYPSYRKHFRLRLRDTGSGRVARWNILREKLERATRARVANDKEGPPDPAPTNPTPAAAASRWIFKTVPA